MAVDYGEDLFQRIVGVHWRKKVTAGLPYATFVFGGLNAEGTGAGGVYTVTATKEDLKDDSPEAKYKFESGMQLVSFGNNFEAVASAYALVTPEQAIEGKPKIPTSVFVVAGNRSEIVGTSDDVGNPVNIVLIYTMIYCSNDGISWREAFEGSPPAPGYKGANAYGNPLALVWDPDSEAFYFEVLKFEGSGTSAMGFDTTFTSKDGSSWGEGNKVSTGFDPSYRSSFPPTYCSHNDCFDADGNHVPDGVMKHDLDAKLTAKPEQPPIINYGTGGHSFDSSSGGVTYGGPGIEINDELLLETFSRSMPFPKVFGVAGIHNIWMAAGSNDMAGDSGAVATSIDRGKTWTQFAAPAGGIHTIVAGAYGAK
jgi:hypothetical protein